MSLVLFVVVTGAFTALALGTRARPPLSTGIGIVGLLLAVALSVALVPGQIVVIGGGAIATTAYVRLFLLLGSVLGLALAISGQAGGSRRDAPTVTLGILATAALTLGVLDPRAAVLVATAGGLFGVLVTLVPNGGRVGATVGVRESRAVGVAGALAIAATAWFGRDLSGLDAQPVVFGLAYLAFAIAVALRFGEIPFHLWAARLADVVPETALPILTAYAPASLALVAVAWIDTSVTPFATDLGIDRLIVVGHRPGVDRAGSGRGIRPGRHRARPRLLDRRRRGGDRPGARRPRSGCVGTDPDVGPRVRRRPQRVRRVGGRRSRRVLDRPGRRPPWLGPALPVAHRHLRPDRHRQHRRPGDGGIRRPDRHRQGHPGRADLDGRADRGPGADRLLRTAAGHRAAAAGPPCRTGRRLAAGRHPPRPDLAPGMGHARRGMRTGRSARGSSRSPWRSSRWRPQGARSVARRLPRRGPRSWPARPTSVRPRRRAPRRPPASRRRRPICRRRARRARPDQSPGASTQRSMSRS